MMVHETFYRPAEASRESRALPADTYNRIHLLVARASEDCVFVPIRSMQYLAILDREEIVFVFREGRRMIEIAWQKFRPQDRDALDAPVAYEAVYYDETAPETMRRLQGEFLKALRDLDGKEPQRVAARIIPLKAPIPPTPSDSPS